MSPKLIADLKLKSSQGTNQASSNPKRNQYTHRCFKERFLERCKGITLVCNGSAHEQLVFILLYHTDLVHFVISFGYIL